MTEKMASDRLLQRLLKAADRACYARGEAQRNDGHLIAYAGGCDANDLELTRLRVKSRELWELCEEAEGRMRRVFLAVLREAMSE